jgi:drug/metabolite transporter (DMT)-like permease
MTAGVFLLVILAAFCHAGWNFTARKASGNLAAIWLGLWLGCVSIVPIILVIFISKDTGGFQNMGAYACIISTGLIHALYFGLVSVAYEYGEISLVYPVSRGSGIALTAALGWFLLNEKVSFIGACGIGIISLGVLSMGFLAYRHEGKTRSVLLSLGTGLSIVAYSLIDKVGVSYVSPIVYIWLMFLIAAVVLTPVVMRRYREKFTETLKKNIGYAAIIGLGSMGTYLMILFAFTIGPVGYIVSVREFSVVLGALSGAVFLNEKLTAGKLVAITAITIGMICIKAG